MDKTELINKVLSGNATEEERNELEQWKSQGESNRVEFEDFKILYHAETADAPDTELSEGLLKLRNRIEQNRRKGRSIHRLVYLVIITVGLALVCWLAYHTAVNERPSIH